MTALIPFSTFADRRSAARGPSPASTAALARGIAEFELKGRQTTHATVKAMARNYSRHFSLVDRVHDGASRMPLPLLYGRLKTRLDFHRSAALASYPQKPMNIRAAMLAVKYMMLIEREETRHLQAAE